MTMSQLFNSLSSESSSAITFDVFDDALGEVGVICCQQMLFLFLSSRWLHTFGARERLFLPLGLPCSQMGEPSLPEATNPQQFSSPEVCA